MIPNSLLTGCQPLDGLTTGSLTDLTSITVSNANKYKMQCSKHSALVQVIQKKD